MPKERQTCTECSMRRQKCDRNLPCGRCVKRGDAERCTREWPDGGYNPKVHRIYPRPEGDSATSPTSQVSTPRTTKKEKQPQTDINVHPALRDNGATPSDSATSPAMASKTPSRPPANDGPSSDIDNAASVLEYLSWGRSKLSDYDMKARDLLKEPHNAGIKDSAPDWDYSNGFGGTGDAQVSFLQLLLPGQRQVTQLVEYHLDCILWYHSCFHGPTFWRELQDVSKGSAGLQIRNMDLRWAALLFSVMAGSMTCASEQLTSSWGFQKSERAKMVRQWYKATVSCLNLADYMWRHHIWSVEAIGTLTMSAHILGFSNTQSVLLGAAYKIAQGLGLQKLGPEVDPPASEMTPAIREKIMKRETGRRLWGQLCCQDWFGIPFSEMYSVQHLHFTTTKAINCDDQTMTRLPDNIPTNVSFGNYLFDIAALMPQMHDAIVSSNTLYTKYDHVREYDLKMRDLATKGLPYFFSMREAIDPKWPAFIPWARRSITICLAHKIIMIHRNFLGRSFTEPGFDLTRRTCMAAAKTILKEARQAYDEEGPMLWIDQAFMVAAGITLALDIFHRRDSEVEYEEHRKLVENTISLLGKFEGSMIGQRGVRLLSTLLTEQARLKADETLENFRKRARDGEVDGGHIKRQKFDVPKFVESFVGNDTFTHSLRTQFKGKEPATESFEPDSGNASEREGTSADLGYETFEQLFPPQAGFSNTFLFEDLLNFNI